MRKILILMVVVLFFAGQARAQQPTFAQLGNPCSTSPVFGNASWCFDTVTTASPGVYYNNGGTWTAVAAGGANPSFTTIKTTGTADRTVNIQNGGHINSTLGTATIPTTSSCGTNTVTATSTDNAFQVAAGSVTACTVIFNVAYTAQPVCTCSDNTTAAGLKIAHSTGVNITVSGLTSGDTFECICIGH